MCFHAKCASSFTNISWEKNTSFLFDTISSYKRVFVSFIASSTITSWDSALGVLLFPGDKKLKLLTVCSLSYYCTKIIFVELTISLWRIEVNIDLKYDNIFLITQLLKFKKSWKQFCLLSKIKECFLLVKFAVTIIRIKSIFLWGSNKKFTCMSQ